MNLESTIILEYIIDIVAVLHGEILTALNYSSDRAYVAAAAAVGW